MSEAEVLIARTNATGRITLNRPQVLHALSTAMCVQMTEALLRWRADDGVEQIIIDHAAGTRGFCGGGDVLMLVASLKKDGADAVEFFANEYRLNVLLQSYPKPIIAMVDGVVMGGGVGISMHGAHRIVTERTTFAMPEVGIGLFPDVGASWLLSRLTGGLGYWLALTGARLKGLDVLAAGIASHFIASEHIAELVRLVEQQGEKALDGLQKTARLSFAEHRTWIDDCFSGPDRLEDIFAKLKADSSEWADTQLAMMAKHCPLSMKIAFKQIQEGAKLRSFEEVMAMEYRIARRIIFEPNFQEGVRALLIDKDQNPCWLPKTLGQVDDEMVDRIFAPLGDDELTFI